MKRESTSSRDKSRSPSPITTRKSSRKDWPNSEVESDLSRLEVDLKSKLAKSRTELLTLFAPLKQPLLKVLSQEVEQLFFTLQKNSINLLMD